MSFIGSWASYGHNGLVSIIHMTNSTTRAAFALLSSKFRKWDTACTLTFSVHAAPLWFQHPCCSLLFLKRATTRATCNPFAVSNVVLFLVVRGGNTNRPRAKSVRYARSLCADSASFAVWYLVCSLHCTQAPKEFLQLSQYPDPYIYPRNTISKTG